MPTRPSTRSLASVFIVVVAIVALAGCVSSEKARYARHLSATVSPEPSSGRVAAGAFTDEDD